MESWAAQAEYDLGVAELLYQHAVYRYCVFFCHLGLERGLKGMILEHTGVADPPRTHNLRSLADAAGLDVPRGYYIFIRDLTAHSVLARYPSDNNPYDYNRANVSNILTQTQEVYEWLKSMSRR